jgi:hypothetical protein
MLTLITIYIIGFLAACKAITVADVTLTPLGKVFTALLWFYIFPATAMLVLLEMDKYL